LLGTAVACWPLIDRDIGLVAAIAIVVMNGARLVFIESARRWAPRQFQPESGTVPRSAG